MEGEECGISGMLSSEKINLAPENRLSQKESIIPTGAMLVSGRVQM